ncbi:MAG: right-handed parallel beta-helix repeat-containing protein [Thermanaerothrix sp.]|uniref:right-handed parallel beta-helix repeat-containing protein n=1 Tax=Thermanaerothrix sp. TaxID=2972675 RepID=UPI003C7D1681
MKGSYLARLVTLIVVAALLMLGVGVTAPAQAENTTQTVTIDLEAYYDKAWVDDNADSDWYLTPGHFAKIQDAIDAVAPGGTVYVYPGDYHEEAINRYVLGTQGPHQFGLFIGQEKTGLKIIGVNAEGQPITDYEDVAATVTTYATNNFGYSGVFVEADDVTIQGLEIKDNIVNNQVSNNKTIEIIGDNFTLRDCHINVGAGEEDGGSVYFGDWRFNTETNTSYIQRYTLEENWFDHGTSVDLANGAGYSGEVSGRQIINNKFTNDPDDYWPFISFNGSDTGVPWFVHSVGGAVIRGNNFINNYNQIGNGVAHIRARGTYKNSQFDWSSYWKDNTYNKAVIFGVNPPSDLGTYSYTSGSYTFNDVRRIGVTIQNEVEKAVNGQTVLIKSGTYEEQVVVSGKTLTLQGEGANVVIKSPSTLTAKFTTSVDNKPVVLVQNNANVTIKNLTVDGAKRGGIHTNYRFIGIGFYNAGGTVENVTVTGVRDDENGQISGMQHGLGIYAYNQDGTARTLTVRNATVTDFQKNGITVVGGGLTATIEGNTITGAGTTSIIAQNGIQVSSGAAATVRNNTVSGIAYSRQSWVASGILVYGAGTTTVEGNILTSSQANIYVVESSATVSANRISTPACAGEGCYGIVASDPLTARPSPLEEAVASTTPAQPNRSSSFTLLGSTNPLDTVTITANEISGVAYSSGESVGLGVYEGYADRDVDVNASQNVIGGWKYGVYVGRCEGDGCYSGRLHTFALNQNAIMGNTVGMGTNLTISLNAERNWWGSAHGPQVATNSGGDGQPIEGSTIDYVPWLCDGTDAQPSQIGFQPVSNAETCTNTPIRLRFIVQPPSTAFTNEPFDPQPQVRVEDAQGNLAINYGNPVLIALVNNPAGGVLGGTLSADPVNGVATFTNLFLNKPGTNYRLLATSGSLTPAYSNDFTVVDPSADLSLNLSVPGSVNAGATFDYTLTVSNAGPKAANALTLTLNLPAGVTYQSASGSGWTCNHSAGTVTCTATSLASGANATVTVNVTAPAQAGTLTATASVRADSPTDPNSANNSASADTTVVVLPPTGGSQIFLPLIMR